MTSHLCPLSFVCSTTIVNISNIEDSSDEEHGTLEDTKESDEDSSESIHEAEHLAAVKQAMKIKGILEHTLAHGVLVGPAGSGKSSLMSRLVGEKPSSTSPSTGVANRVVQVEARKSSSIAVNVHPTALIKKLLPHSQTRQTHFLSQPPVVIVHH